jgi:predicted aspartyl protease
MSQRVIYPLELRNGMLFLRVSLGDGKNAPVIARLLIDTGSSYTVLSTRILQDAGCDIRNVKGASVSITAAGGVVQGIPVTVPRFCLLGQTIENCRVVGFNLPSTSNIDGLLGINLLRNCGATIDTVKAEIIIQVKS